MEEFICKIREIIWGPPLLVLLLGTGAYLMILLRGLPVKKLFPAIRLALQGDDRGKEGVSAFSSLATELAATIGTGNVAGVVSAMTLGGPGALLWMQVGAALGLATKLVESTLSVKYRIKGEKGIPVGGPMITLKYAFPRKRLGAALAFFYALMAFLVSLGMGNMVQSNSIADVLGSSFGLPARKTGLILGVLTLFAVMGGIRLISKVSAYLVPAMGALYLAGCLGILILCRENLVSSIRDILIGAFSPRAVSGGAFGMVTCTTLQSVSAGISRGVFSNEAGLGAAGISAAASREESCVKQGLISMTGVFFDTMLICTLTGLSFAASKVAGPAGEGRLFLKNGSMVTTEDASGLMAAAFESVYGRYGSLLLGICVTLFAFATILGWAAQGEAAFSFLFGSKRIGVFCVIYAICALLGALFSPKIIWNASDVANGLLAIPNLICVLVMAKETAGTIRKKFI